MVLSPVELNAMGDDELCQHVEAVIEELNNPNSERKWFKKSPFVTADILMRLHNFVALARRRNNDRCGGWSKQATLARVVGCFTGISIQQSDAEYIGNAEDYFLHNYSKNLKKAASADKMQAHRARKAGTQLPTSHGHRESQLKLQIYTCKFGGVPRNIISRDPETIPVRRFEHADEVNRQLQEEIIKLKQEDEKGRGRDMQHNLNALCAAVEFERRARGIAEQHAAELEMSYESEAATAAAHVQEVKKKLRDASQESQRVNGQIARLGGLLSASHVEVARSLAREENVVKEAKQRAQALQDAKESEVREMTAKLQDVQQRVRDANAECTRLRGQVARLGSQLCNAHIEVTRACEREDKCRREAEKAAADAAKQHVEAVATVTQQLRSVQTRMREQARESLCAEGKMQRLGSQLGCALVEAARAAEQAKQAHTVVDLLQQRLKDQETVAEEKLRR